MRSLPGEKKRNGKITVEGADSDEDDSDDSHDMNNDDSEDGSDSSNQIDSSTVKKDKKNKVAPASSQGSLKKKRGRSETSSQ